MKAVGNIYVAWRKGKGSRRILVGVIKKSATGISFRYLLDGVREAQPFGFTTYEGFSYLDKKYTENVIQIFGQRIMRSERNDVDDFYDFWQIDKQYNEDIFYMLAYTQGLLPTDNYEFLADFNPTKDISFISEISGLSKLSLAPDALKKGELLIAKKEPENSQDNRAVKLYKGDMHVGYLKKVHSRVFYKTKHTLKVTIHHIEKNGKINRVFLKVTA